MSKLSKSRGNLSHGEIRELEGSLPRPGEKKLTKEDEEKIID